MRTGAHVSEPKGWFVDGFGDYVTKRLRREFHRMRLLGEEPRPPAGPLVVYANHGSWWDPLVALAIRPRFFPDRKAYAPIDAAMLERYGIFRHLGFFGVDRSSPRGVIRFLEEAGEVLRRPGAMLFLTPQGRFADVRERPVRLQPGLGSLAERVEGAGFLPLAVECVFWEESRAEVLLHFGEVGRFPGGVDRDEASAKLATALGEAQDRLAAASIARRAGEFQVILEGRSGVGGIYDVWRRVKACATGRAPELGHGEL